MTTTTKAAHTPGPWQYGDLCEELFHLHRVGNSVVTQVICSRPAVEPPSGPTDEQWEANTRLIAAAPDLFTELEMAHRHIGHLLQMLNGDRRKETKEIDAIADRVPQRMAAIQKARGGQ